MYHIAANSKWRYRYICIDRYSAVFLWYRTPQSLLVSLGDLGGGGVSGFWHIPWRIFADFGYATPKTVACEFGLRFNRGQAKHPGHSFWLRKTGIGKNSVKILPRFSGRLFDEVLSFSSPRGGMLWMLKKRPAYNRHKWTRRGHFEREKNANHNNKIPRISNLFKKL